MNNKSAKQLRQLVYGKGKNKKDFRKRTYVQNSKGTIRAGGLRRIYQSLKRGT